VVNATFALWFAWAAEWAAWLRGTTPGLSQKLVLFSQMNRWYDISKARDRLGYVPRVSLEEGLRRAVEVRVTSPETARREPPSSDCAGR